MPAIADTVAATLDAWAREGRVLAWPAARALAFDVAATVLVGTRFGSDTIRARPALNQNPSICTACVPAWKQSQATLFYAPKITSLRFLVAVSTCRSKRPDGQYFLQACMREL